MDSWKTLFLLFSVIGFTWAEEVNFKDCGSSTGKVSTVNITPCLDHPNPCKLKKGENYSVNVTFLSNVETLKSTAVVHGVIAGVPVPFPIPVSDGCQSGINCPIEMQKFYNYVTTLPVKTEYPCLKLVVEWELKDDGSKDLFCIKFPVEIVS
ncbi:NPC intracellular cholesterol transporter 2 [Boleophthalmus pectinirostris]|uniref:NPC intracellular cholesterol transporter 2 n=1 Tax=Boleophthalmus pectinirostris TaxID=150288 RepID=UPI000A1C2949|nr:NPC intracellular cholesterol transporter 2 [Boleophthalmus pectinirostris]XP_055004129.1 NPC intracellular cholesterol transporter 2 [Boleophthalmus pectinirostris]